MRHSSKHHRLGGTSSLALAIALAIPAAIALPAVAHAQETAQQFDIPAGDLSAALERYSAQTDMQLVYSSDLIAGKRSPGVSGRMSPQQALGQLLAGSGLSARVSGNSATLVQAGASGDVAAAEGERLLGPVRVEGSQGAYQSPVRGDGIAQLGGIRGGQDEEAVGYRAKIASVSTGVPIAIEDIPRSITVQTQEQIEKQDIVNLSDALERMPGIVIQDRPSSSSAPDKVISRGYDIEQYHVDGGPARDLTSLGSGLQTLDAYERVELVRGPNALLAGAGSPGGSINLIRKRPGPVQASIVKAEAGSFNRLGVIGDVSTPSLFGSPVAFRGIASIRREGAEYEDYDQRSILVSGLFDMPLGENARLELGASYNNLKVDGGYAGVPRYFDGPLIELPRTFNISDKSEMQRVTSTEIFGKLFVDVAQDWDFELGTSYVSGKSRARHLLVNARLVSTDNEAWRPGRLDKILASPSRKSQLSVDAKLNGRFKTFGLTHNVFAQGSYDDISISHEDGSNGSLVYATAEVNSLDDLLNPQYVEIPRTGNSNEAVYSGQSLKTVGLVIGDTIDWRDIVSFTALFRRDIVSNDFVTGISLTDGTTRVPNFSKGVTNYSNAASWRPSVSASIKPTKNLTLFASYADGFRRQDQFYMRTGDGPDYSYAPLPPTTFQNKEVGLKYGTSKWLMSASAYRIDQKDQAYYLGFNECPPAGLFGPTGEACYGISGSSYTKGFDIEFTGELLSGLHLTSNFNYSKSYDTPPELMGGGSFVSSRLPATAGNVFVDWRPRFFEQLSVQVGARYRGRIYQTGTRRFLDEDHQPLPCPNNDCSYEYEEKPYLIFDVGADLQVSENLGFRIFVENVTDRKYLSTVSNATSGGNFYGRPRTIMASLKWQSVSHGTGDGRSPTNGLAPFGDPSDWYAGFGLGYALSPTLQSEAKGKAQDGVTSVEWNFHTRNRPFQVVNLGYRATGHVRLELEGAHRTSPFTRIGGNSVAPFGVCGTDHAYGGEPFDCDNVPGEVEAWSLIGNAVYDFGRRGSLLRPYLGAGVGLARHTVGFQGKMAGIGGDTPWVNILDLSECCNQIIYLPDTVRASQEFVGAQDTSVSLAWQAITGVSVKIGNRLEIDASYRYFTIPAMKWGVYNMAAPASDGTQPLTPALKAFRGNYATHSFALGLRWAFGQIK